MKVRKAIKSIVALGMGLTMLGATIFGATAVDLGAYPTQYIKSGQFDGLMVVGSNAKTEDVLGIVDIATSLQFASKVDKAVGTGTTTLSLEGDNYLISSNANNLELGEALGEIKSTIDESSDLGILETGTIKNSKGSTDVKQYLKIGNSGLKAVYESNTEADPEYVGPFIKADSGTELFTYEVQFSDNLDSDVDSNNKLEDIEDEDLVMLGKDYSIVEGELTGPNEVTLTLMGGALTDTLKEGEMKTYEINGKKYETSVLIIADSGSSSDNAKVKMMVNGEVTNSMEDGDTSTLDDGTVIGVRDILANEGSETAGDDIVSFYLGANKMVLNGGDNSVEIADDQVDDLSVSITATNSSKEVSISKISFTLDAPDTIYMEKNSTLSSYLETPESMISNAWDIMFTGITEPKSTDIVLNPSGDDKYYLDFESQDNYEYRVLLLDRASDGTISLGKETSEKFAYNELTPIKEDGLFVLSKGTAEYDANTHILSLSDIRDSDNELTFQEEADGNSATYKVKYDKTQNVTINNQSYYPLDKDTITIGGDDYAVFVDASAPTDHVLVDMNGDGSITNTDATIISKGGVEIKFSNLNLSATDGNEVLKTSFEIDPDLEEDATSGPITVSIKAANTKEFDLGSINGVNLDSNEDSDNRIGMNQYGLLVEEQNKDDGANKLTITVPEDQVNYEVYVVGDDVQTKTTTTAGKTVSEYKQINVGAAVLDTEVGNIQNNNLIVVGGPCANSVAATLLGIPNSMPQCYENFPVKEGEGLIKMVQNGDKVAIVVAGYSAQDTRRASQVLAKYDSNVAGLKGKAEVVVSGSTIKAPTTIETTPVANTTNTTA